MGDYYDLKDETDGANDPPSYVAPSGLGSIWALKDVPLFDDILEFVKTNACVDTSRLFVPGFSKPAGNAERLLRST